MERIRQTELSLASKSSEPLAISQPLPQSSEEAIQCLRDMGAAEWEILILQIAQDKRHDVAPHALRYWGLKLKNIPDELICEALKTGRWNLFPSVDEVLLVIDEIRERRHQESGWSEYRQYQESQRRAKENGLLATEEDYAAMRAKLRELFGDPTARAGVRQ